MDSVILKLKLDWGIHPHRTSHGKIIPQKKHLYGELEVISEIICQQ